MSHVPRGISQVETKIITNLIKIQSLFRRFNAMSRVDNLRNERIFVNRRYEINNSEDIINYQRERDIRQYDHRIKINYVNYFVN